MNKYFDFGCPANPNEQHYGLYQPTIDRILFTVEELDLAQQLSLVMSSRYNLYLYELSQAENYTANLIDNACCTNWTISNKDQLQVTQSYTLSVMPVEKLIESHQLTPEFIDCSTEQEWMQMSLHWLRFIKYLKLKSYQWYNVERFIRLISHDVEIPQGFSDQIHNFERQVNRLLYLGKDMSIDLNIRNLVDQTDFLKIKYQQWSRR